MGFFQYINHGSYSSKIIPTYIIQKLPKSGMRIMAFGVSQSKSYLAWMEMVYKMLIRSPSATKYTIFLAYITSIS